MQISIEGNIGSGKSTIWNALQQRQPQWSFVKEPVDLWTEPTPSGPSMLELFYHDIPKNSQAFQMQALSTRAKCLADGLAKHSTVVSERSPVTDKNIFYKMNEKTYSECEKNAYQTVQNNLVTKEPDLIVQLRCEPDVCLERIHKRQRAGEDPISLEQLHLLHSLHETMAQRSNIAIVSTHTDDIDFIVNQVERAIQIFQGQPRDTIQSA